MSLIANLKVIMQSISLDGDNTIFSVTFAQDERHVLCGTQEGVLWVNDTQVTKSALETDGPVYAVVLSKDGLWITTGELGKVTIWDAKTHEKVHEMNRHKANQCVSAIDVSDDSMKVASGSDDKTVCIFSITSGRCHVGPILHENFVVGVKFSPCGRRVATAAVNRGVRVFDVSTGAQLVFVSFAINRNPGTPLAWSTDGRKIFVAYPGKIACLDPLQKDSSSPDSLPVGSEWSIHNSNGPISIENNGRFIACSAGSSISFWDPSSYQQLGHPIAHSAIVSCFALTSNGKYLVCGTTDKKITIHDLHESLADSCFIINLPLIRVSDAAIHPWLQGSSASTEVLLSEEVIQHPSHHTFANRALIRGHLKQWNAAIDDAKKSLEIESSPIGHIAHARALIGQQNREAALWAFDLAFRDCDRSEIKLLLLVKSILLFLSGGHSDAILRIQKLILPEDHDIAYCCFRVLACMYLELADYENVIKSLEQVKLLAPPCTSPYLMTISLIFGDPFNLSDISTQRRICDRFYDIKYTKEAAGVFLNMGYMSRRDQIDQAIQDWRADFTKKCIEACERKGDGAFVSLKLDEAIAQYSAALSLCPSTPIHLLVKRSKAAATAKSWDDALHDAQKAIDMDSSCPSGYEARHAALYGSERFEEAIGAYGDFLSALENSHDPRSRRKSLEEHFEKSIEHVLESRLAFLSPDQKISIMEEELGRISTCPFVLIDVVSGRLCCEKERKRIFRLSPVFKKLVSGMTNKLDQEQIAQAVANYFEYAMLSHTWEGEEPTFQDVNTVGSVWDLETSAYPLNAKLRNFCEEVRELGYFWAWSDTCCIDKTNSESIINRSLTLMYEWYAHSAATLVFLSNVNPGPGAITRSRWFLRSWTLQELLAPKVVRFYDCNWNPYLDDIRKNHKEPGVIMDELSSLMELSSSTITSFRPENLTVREKLRLASSRSATEEEDEAYALIGIFQSDMRPKYGEKKAALGNLLQEVVARLQDVTVLAWNGVSSSFNSCLPLSLSVYSEPPYTVEPIIHEKMEARISELRTRVRRDQALAIFNQLIQLPRVVFESRRLTLRCIVFPVMALELLSDNPPIYRAMVPGPGKANIMTTDLLPLKDPRHLALVNPWIRDIKEYCKAYHAHVWQNRLTSHLSTETGTDEIMDADLRLNSSVLLSSTLRLRPDKFTQALQLIACLEQPFNAFMLIQQPDGEFRRIATENKIIVSGLKCDNGSLEGIYVDALDIL